MAYNDDTHRPLPKTVPGTNSEIYTPTPPSVANHLRCVYSDCKPVTLFVVYIQANRQHLLRDLKASSVEVKASISDKTPNISGVSTTTPEYHLISIT